ncbi:MAG: cation:proton antiporter [Archaeoglobaceae archaeon]
MDIYILLSVILGLSALFAFIFNKIGFSHVAGYLFAGIVLSLTFHERFEENAEILQFFSEVAITLLLFEIGREIGFENIKRINLLPILILSFELFTAFFVAILFGTLLKLVWAEIFIIGVIASFSSTAVIFKLMGELKFESEIKELVLTVMILEDICAIVILAILPQLRFGGIAISEMIRLVIFSLVIAASLTLIGIRLLNKFFIRLIMPNELGIAIAIGSAFLFATISKYFGLSPALGAFSAGLALSTHPRNSELGEYLKPVREIFLILFFVSLGLEAGLIQEINILLLFFIPLIVFGRFFAFTTSTWIASKRSLDESIRIGFLATSVGEFGMVIAYEAVKLQLVGAGFLTLSALAVITGTIISSKLSQKKSYSEKISSLVPIEVKLFIDQISTNVAKLMESKASEFAKATVFRIMRNVIAIFLTTLLCSLLLYLLSFFPSIGNFFAAVILATMFAVILAIAIKTKKQADVLCCILVEKRGLNPVVRNIFSGLTFIFLMMMSLNIAMLVSGRLIADLINKMFNIEIGNVIMFATLIILFSLTAYVLYLRLKEMPL